MAGVPSQKIEEFLETYILGQPDLVFTIKSASGASVNIDGPFHLKLFDWPRLRPKAEHPQEKVIQPAWATTREGSHETSVHVHVPWDSLWVRLHVIEMELTDYQRRIAFYRSRPPDHLRGDELFFFYARAGHALDKHRDLGGPPKYGQGQDRWGDALLLA
jgi:hypothetical protein